ncbi:hypothetical protein NTGM5_320027 [Candidatus Nitrotoga sp. M5]|nr:hypothetical protein NTGM5_320027 [Candidatus Nitrotoga sp. M5]
MLEACQGGVIAYACLIYNAIAQTLLIKDGRRVLALLSIYLCTDEILKVGIDRGAVVRDTSNCAVEFPTFFSLILLVPSIYAS